MPDLLLDSDVIIDLLRGDGTVAEEMTFLEGAGWTVSYTPVAKAEIYHGMRKRDEKAVEGFFAACRCLPVTDEVGEKAGRYLAAFHLSHGVELGDALVAASAHVYKSSLFTRNRKHFPMKDIVLHACRRS